MPSPEPIDYDGAWKEALEKYFHPFLEFCFPQVAAGIDWRVPLTFLDQELQEIVREANLGKQRADKLARVQRLDGSPELVLVHVEVQSRRDADLARRMYQYHHRISDRYGQPVASLAVLADMQATWRPGAYEEELWGCRLRFEYPLCKLLDFTQEPEKLAASNNPVAIVIAAHLAAQGSAKDMERRYSLKWQLTRRLYERGYHKQEVLELFRLVDWLLVLPAEQAVAFRRELVQYELEKAMPYVTSIERMGREEGLQIGRQEGRREGLIEGRVRTLREVIVEVIETRFENVPQSLRNQLNAVQDEHALKELLRGAARASSMEQFLSALGRWQQ